MAQPRLPKPRNLQDLEAALTGHETTITAISHLKHQTHQAHARGDHFAAFVYRELYQLKEQPIYDEVSALFPKDDAGLLTMFRENSCYYAQEGNLGLQHGYAEAAQRLMEKMGIDRNGPATFAGHHSMHGNQQYQAPPARYMVPPAAQHMAPPAARYMALPAAPFMATPAARYMALPAPFMASPAPFMAPQRQHPSYAHPFAFPLAHGHQSFNFNSPMIQARRNDVHISLQFVNFTAADFQIEHHHSYYDREFTRRVDTAMYEANDDDDSPFTDRDMNDFVMRVEGNERYTGNGGYGFN